MTPSRQAVIICTRNRPGDLQRTLESICGEKRPKDLLVSVVDASDPATAEQNRSHVHAFDGTFPGAGRYRYFEGPPSAACQRNAGIDALPPDIGYVHFLDDDVTVLPHYFEHIIQPLEEDFRVGGVGGATEDIHATASWPPSFAKRLFLLDSARPGRVLASGRISIGQALPRLSANRPPFRVEWLSTCACTYRRSILESYRFDEALSRNALLEDRDLSYRIGQAWDLLVVPQARLVHRFALQARLDTQEQTYMRLINRYWFVQKNLPGLTSRVAFWWSVLGHLLALLASDNPARHEALRGLRRAVQDICTGNHPLLRPRGQKE